MNSILKAKEPRFKPEYVNTRDLIPARIAFAKSVDVSKCPDVQNFIMEKANYEAFLEDCRKPQKMTLLEVREQVIRKPFWSQWKAILP